MNNITILQVTLSTVLRRIEARFLEEEMGTQSSILAWKIPWRGKPGRLQSMGLQRVAHN